MMVKFMFRVLFCVRDMCLYQIKTMSIDWKIIIIAAATLIGFFVVVIVVPLSTHCINHIARSNGKKGHRQHTTHTIRRQI